MQEVWMGMAPSQAKRGRPQTKLREICLYWREPRFDRGGDAVNRMERGGCGTATGGRRRQSVRHAKTELRRGVAFGGVARCGAPAHAASWIATGRSMDAVMQASASLCAFTAVFCCWRERGLEASRAMPATEKCRGRSGRRSSWRGGRGAHPSSVVLCVSVATTETVSADAASAEKESPSDDTACDARRAVRMRGCLGLERSADQASKTLCTNLGWATSS